jgi:ribosomal protein S18 acetylase RimI-like enzyme
MTDGSGVIEAAAPGDANVILAFMTEAFGATSLKFTVYQSARAVGFVKEQIVAAVAEARPSFFLLRGRKGLEGFYHAVDHRGEFFLNYIATERTTRKRGAGRRLLDHFEATGAARGYASVALEVFRSNAVALAWYRRRGYIACGSRFRVRFELPRFSTATGFELELDPLDLERALAKETDEGFSSIDTALRGMPVRLGFIGGAVCNLMEPRGAQALAAAPDLARRFGASRRWLLASGPQVFAGEPPPESQEEALYMSKLLAQRDPAMELR